MEKLLKLKNNFSVKIISGVRGVGKTSLLKNFAEHLRAESVAEDEIIFVDCSAEDRPKDFQAFYEFVEAQTFEREKFFLLVDDFDRVAEGEKAINALFVSSPAEIYLTVSSEAFAEKISALLPENCDALKIYPLSFVEYVKFSSAEDALKIYLHFGGLPAALGADEKFLPKLLRGLTYEIMFDLLEKNSLQRAELFRLLMETLAQNAGKPTTMTSMANRLIKFSTALSTFKNYFACGASLFRKIPRFDIKTEKFLPGAEKFYCVDNGILFALNPKADENILIDNAVCVELWRRGCSVSSGKFGAMNITFVAERDGEKFFVQVLPTSGLSAQRATRPLRALPADAKKVLITLKREKKFDGVTNITLRDFLLDAEKIF